MRILKDDKYKAILDAARQEFILKGFKEASMRSIAQKADVGLSNIYNYFKNKNEIFIEVVRPAKEDLYAFIRKHHTEESLILDMSSQFGHKDEVIDYYIDLIYKYKEEIRLLLFHSEGSSMNGFRESFTDFLTEISLNYIQLEKKLYPQIFAVSHFFIHTMSAWTVSVLGEIVTHNLNKRETRDFFREYFRYQYAGWRELTGI